MNRKTRQFYPGCGNGNPSIPSDLRAWFMQKLRDGCEGVLYVDLGCSLSDI